VVADPTAGDTRQQRRAAGSAHLAEGAGAQKIVSVGLGLD
jgi:hypothetical protein